MLRRIISLAIVWVGLLLAASQAVACAPSVPLEDCCPSGPGGPCHALGGLTSTAQAVCCAGGVATPAATASRALRSDRETHSATGNPAAAVVAVIFETTTGWRRFATSVGNGALAYHPSGSALYLSTGRLRL